MLINLIDRQFEKIVDLYERKPLETNAFFASAALHLSAIIAIALFDLLSENHVGLPNSSAIELEIVQSEPTETSNPRSIGSKNQNKNGRRFRNNSNQGRRSLVSNASFKDSSVILKGANLSFGESTFGKQTSSKFGKQLGAAKKIRSKKQSAKKVGPREIRKKRKFQRKALSDLIPDGPNHGPTYPISARVKRLEGQIRLNALVDQKGRVRKVVVRKSSGHRILDKASIEAFKKFRFKPLQRPVVIDHTYEFGLNR